MDKESLPALLLLVLSLILLSNHPVLADDPLFLSCDDEANYTLNGPFETNLNLLLESLTYNTSLTGFNNTSVGDSPNVVYGQALCRGDVNSTVCQDCINTASQGILSGCNTTGAMIWYEFCQIRYSFQKFFSMASYTGKYPDSNHQEQNTSDKDHFDKVQYLMNNISAEAAFDASKNMFATGEVKVSSDETIYGLVQCTRDLSGANCDNCFQSAMRELDVCCNFRQGGMILSRNCNMRFERYPFYNYASGVVLTYPASKAEKWKIWMIVVVTSTLALAILIGSSVVFIRRKKRTQQVDEERSQHTLLYDLARPAGVAISQDENLVSSQELSFMDLATIRAATGDFSDTNKLGQGGFGTVYKGILSNGNEIAVKRLSRRSWQGLEEFKNEVILIAKLQHRNLVRLLGCGLEGEENLLIYEFMPNRSLDTFIFDSERRSELDWKTCQNIIDGIARGLIYLHEDSRLRIIHRDLKPSNVLLDHDMVAKISDFGMARIFGENQNSANTRRVVGSYGYMAPEYAMEGLFSVKSDVFSFGVILLEIISGKRNSGFYITELAQTLVAYAWRLWNEGKELEFIDPLLMESTCPTAEVLRCIHIGLLCVQEDPAERPTMSSVVVLLGSQAMPLPQPRKPAISVGRAIPLPPLSTASDSVSDMTISSILPR